MKKILVVTNNSVRYSFNILLYNGFKKAGWDVSIIDECGSITESDYVDRLRQKLGFPYSKKIIERQKKYNIKILNTTKSFNPDIVYLCQGSDIYPETVETLQKKAFVIVDMEDLIDSRKDLIPILKYANIIFTFDQNDVINLKQYNNNVIFKPAAYDNEVYKPLNIKKDIDVSFVGYMYPERRRLLNLLVKEHPEYKYEFWGEYAPLRFPLKWLKWKFSYEHKYFKNKNIPPVEVNEIYNRSKIVLNIVRENQQDGWSSRLTQILGSKAFQITNYFDTVSKNFYNCLITYKNDDEYLNSIVYYLKHDKEREEIAKNGYDKVFKDFAYDINIKTILDSYINMSKVNYD